MEILNLIEDNMKRTRMLGEIDALNYVLRKLNKFRLEYPELYKEIEDHKKAIIDNIQVGIG